MILDELDFDDLISAAEANTIFSKLGDHIFHRKYSNFEFLIDYQFKMLEDEPPKELEPGTVSKAFQWLGLTTLKKVEKNTHSIRGNRFHFIDFNTTLRAFNHFGDRIHKLHVNYNFCKESQVIFFGELISNFSSNSLTELTIEYLKFYHLNQIKVPLQNVTTVYFRGYVSDSSNRSYQLSERFPKIERLYINNC